MTPASSLADALWAPRRDGALAAVVLAAITASHSLEQLVRAIDDRATAIASAP